MEIKDDVLQPLRVTSQFVRLHHIIYSYPLLTLLTQEKKSGIMNQWQLNRERVGSASKLLRRERQKAANEKEEIESQRIIS